MATVQLEPMSVSEILDGSFKLYRNNLIRFVAIVAVVQIPVGLVSLCGQTLMHMGTEAAGPGGQPQFSLTMGLSALGLGLFVLSVGMVGQALANAALVKSVSESYLGNEVTVGEAYRFALPKLFSLIGAGMLVGLLCGFGFFMCVVPGVIFSLWFAMTTQAIVFEDLGAFRGMSRSKELASGNLGKILGVWLIVVLIMMLVGGVFATVGGVFSMLVPGVTGFVLRGLCQLVGQVLIAPIGAAAFNLLYYDLRIRKEGFDLEMLAERLGSPRAIPVADRVEP